MEKIILLFGQDEPVKAAVKNNFYVINILTELQTKDDEYFEAVKLSHELKIISSESEILDTVEKIKNENTIKGIFSFTDTRDGVQLAAELSEKFLNGNCYKSVLSKDVEILNNKIRTRQYIDSIGITNIPYIFSEKKNKLAEFLNDNNKIIMKPFNGQGSLDVYLIENKSEINTFDTNSKWLGEKFIIGQEYSVEGIFVDGRHYILGITQKTKIGLNDNGHNQFVELAHEFPADISNHEANLISKYIYDFYQNIEAMNVLTHTEVIIGEDKDVYLVEGHFRPGGDAITKLILSSYELDVFDLFFRSFLEPQEVKKKIATRKLLYRSAIKYFIPKQTGKVDNIFLKFELDDKLLKNLDAIYINYLNNMNNLAGEDKELIPVLASFDRELGAVLVRVKNGTDPMTLIDSIFKKIQINFTNKKYSGDFF